MRAGLALGEATVGVELVPRHLAWREVTKHDAPIRVSTLDYPRPTLFGRVGKRHAFSRFGLCACVISILRKASSFFM